VGVRVAQYANLTILCQRLATVCRFSPGTPVSSTNKTDRHDIMLMFLKVALNNITAQFIFCGGLCCSICLLWGFVLLNLLFVGVPVALFIFCGVHVAQFIFCGIHGFLRVLRFHPPIKLTVTI
jgi:hypothetical protein